ncbi:hypothetical protein [Sphingopyxis flava]|uniref:Uncharacterized protein n=1 Tax=Sphingopyxis flava TaxID=1507287 RepID=A0A1T5AT80_9SPHN|nr:hypothetical protein [Sphingopyxis flava]SKB37783.1 hypothetical protein SAMN06295937_1004129 [Sphingopyxis flava]
MAKAVEKGVGDALRGIRDRLSTELTLLDALGEFAAAVELDAAIRILDERLEKGSPLEMPLPD